jgi:dipeptidyl aminopeptidase/acylaminoacyl peptidase
MAHRTNCLIACLLAVGWIVAYSSNAKAAEPAWEKVSDKVEGQVADFEGVGGVKIAGYVRKPIGAGPFPIIIILHGGGPSAKPIKTDGDADEARGRKLAGEAIRASNQLGRSSNPPIPDFLAQGWAVYTIDYRPTPKYTLDPTEWDDTIVAVNKARAFPFVDPKRMAMFGGSHGGHVTGRMISRVKLSCAVLCAPAGLDLIELAKLADLKTPVGANQGLIRGFEQRAGVKMSEVAKDPDAYHYSSLLTEVPKIQCPILLISGKNDPNAPLPVMDLYVEKVHAAGKEVESYHPANGPHGFYVALPKPIPETAEATQQAIAFIKKHFEQATR